MTARDKLTFAVTGMGCEGCVDVIENAVMPMTCVAYVGISLSGGTMTVRPGPGFDPVAMVSRIVALGYGVDEAPVEGNRSNACPCTRPAAVGPEGLR
jgi:copper chaperone CopZ